MAEPTTIDSAGQALEAIPRRLEDFAANGPLGQIIPFADFVYGGGLLVFIVILHGVAINLVTKHLRKRCRAIAQQPGMTWRADVLFGYVIFLLLAVHLAEVVLWTTALVYPKLVPDWRTAAFFVANTYTTVGYGIFVLPAGWHMLAPIIAISGLFTFGWTGSVLVGFVASINQLKDAAAQVAQGAAVLGGPVRERDPGDHQ